MVMTDSAGKSYREKPTQPDAASDVDALLGGYSGVDPSDTAIDELLGGYEGVSPDEVAASNAAAAAAARRRPISAPTPARGAPTLVASEPKGFRPWMLWWIPTALIPLLGGGVAWMVLRDRRPRDARIMMGVGLATGLIASVLFARYAYQIALWVTGVSRDTIIVQPPSTAPSP
jgi:hypothetical protein